MLNFPVINENCHVANITDPQVHGQLDQHLEILVNL